MVSKAIAGDSLFGSFKMHICNLNHLYLTNTILGTC